MTCRFLTAASLTLLFAIPAVAADVPPQRAFEQMRGTCSDFQWNLAREFSLWTGAPLAATAATKAADAPAVLLERRHDVALVPTAGVIFAQPPQQLRGEPGRYSGIVRFSVPADGRYRVSAGNSLWYDVVAGDRLVESAAFEMQTRCDTIFKSVVFDLTAGTPLLLQFNGSPTEVVGVLITRWPD
jgi:hypothetical protein